MVFSLTGVLQDGTPHRGVVPTNTAVPLFLAHDTDAEVRIRVCNPSGAPIPIDDAALTLTARRSLLDCAGHTHFVATLGHTRGEGVFTIPATALQHWRPGRYYYDVTLVAGGQRDQVVATSPLILLPAVARS